MPTCLSLQFDGLQGYFGKMQGEPIQTLAKTHCAHVGLIRAVRHQAADFNKRSGRRRRWQSVLEGEIGN
jgi:hypothetical protein